MILFILLLNMVIFSACGFVYGTGEGIGTNLRGKDVPSVTSY